MALSASWIATWAIAYMRDSLRGLSAGAMQAARAAFPACAFHAVTAFDRGWGFALAGVTITTAVASATVQRRMKGTRPPIECCGVGVTNAPRPARAWG